MRLLKLNRANNMSGNKIINKLSRTWRNFYIITHFPFSAQGLFFLSGAWMRGSFFSFSSTYSRIAAMDFDRGQRSIDAWYFMFSICFFKASLSMVANVLASIRVRLFELELTQASICNSFMRPTDGGRIPIGI